MARYVLDHLKPYGITMTPTNEDDSLQAAIYDAIESFEQAEDVDGQWTQKGKR